MVFERDLDVGQTHQISTDCETKRSSRDIKSWYFQFAVILQFKNCFRKQQTWPQIVVSQSQIGR